MTGELTESERAFRAQLLASAERFDTPERAVYEAIHWQLVGATSSRRDPWRKVVAGLGGALVAAAAALVVLRMTAAPANRQPAQAQAEQFQAVTPVARELVPPVVQSASMIEPTPSKPPRKVVVARRNVAAIARSKPVMAKGLDDAPVTVTPTAQAKESDGIVASGDSSMVSASLSDGEGRSEPLSVVGPPVAAARLRVWDGDQVGLGASGWSAPDQELKAIEVVAGSGIADSRGLVWRAEGIDWLGFGWNWFSWYPADAGTDIAGLRWLTFQLRVTTVPPNLCPNVQGFGVALTSSGGSGKRDTRPLSLEGLLPENVCDGQWHRVEVPLDRLLSGATERQFDPHKVWEFRLSHWSHERRQFVANVDEIEFLK